MNIGILSFAHVHAEHYQALLKATPGVNFVGYWDDGPEAGLYASLYGIRQFDTPEALLAEVEGVVVCSETSRHLEFVKLAAQSGVHVLCEKPIATTVQDAEAMRDICENYGVRFMTAFPMRFDPTLVNLRERLTAQELGTVLGVNGINHSENPTHHRKWFGDPAQSGGGAVIDHVVHLVDLVRWAFQTEVQSVYASIQWQMDPYKLDTGGLLLLNLQNRVQVSIDCSWSRPSSYPRWGHFKLEVIGEEGVLFIDPFADHMTVYGKNTPATWMGFGPDPIQGMLDAFVDAVKKGEQPAVGWQDGFETLRVIQAVYESDRTGQPVELRPL
ncbi:Gfo/Idh/MocA family protein [Deinococcus roseus]|uniref:Dehydrogenase n=1 Tax=Deinococcus roseus TaxID=392414 RepID=A0ABQ2D2G3_9DEIO|nr:Gfo/Idh/MocA family oxidoreductase [Deinococcus roseus]GGJ43055.1 dehydrogenase [Deinococcus roseus]